MEKKRIRIPDTLRDEILVEFSSCCAVCLMPAHEIHHIDGNSDNNKKENLIPLCQFCHDVRVHGIGFRIKENQLRLYREHKGPKLKNDFLRYERLEEVEEQFGKIKNIEDIEWKQGLILRFLLHCTDYASNNWRDLKGWVRYWTIGLVEGGEIDSSLDELEDLEFIQINNGIWKLTEEGKRWAEKIDYWFLRQAKEVHY